MLRPVPVRVFPPLPLGREYPLALLGKVDPTPLAEADVGGPPQHIVQADTKPELKIFADDVKCSHGATVGDLDTDALFYLLSRGIGPVQARRLLIEAFAGELLDEIGLGPLREDISARLTAWLAAGAGELEKAA